MTTQHYFYKNRKIIKKDSYRGVAHRGKSKGRREGVRRENQGKSVGIQRKSEKF